MVSSIARAAATAATLCLVPAYAFVPCTSVFATTRARATTAALQSSEWASMLAGRASGSGRVAGGARAGGVASLRCEVLPEGGVSPCVIKVIGVGGGGGNAVVRMTQQPIPGVEFWCLNTDAQAINRVNGSLDQIKTLQIGNDVTRGLGAGGVPDIGKRAAEESRADIAEVVAGADLVFVTAGMGGGTGSGAAPIIADVAKEMGALTVGVVTKPFRFEGRRRMTQATTAINELRGAVDTLIVVANDKLLEITAANIPLERAFSVADDILRQGVVGISEIIVRPGIINVDFADVRSVMSNAGTALMGIGRGEGKTKAEDAAAAAISSPLLDEPIDKAKGIVFNIVGGNDMSLSEINAAAEVIYANVDPTANIIFGALVDERMEGEMSITVLATGFQTRDELDAEQAGRALPNQRQHGVVGQGGMSRQGGGGGYGQQATPRQQPPQAPRRPPPPPGYQQDYPQGPPMSPPPPGGANNPSDIPDFLTRLKRSQR